MRLDLNSDYYIVKTEVERMQTLLNSQKCMKFMRKGLIAFVSFIEFANGRYDPLGVNLNGWSEHIMTTLGDYDSCFMRLYDKYRNKTGAVPPEAELLLLLGGSGMMYHLTQSFVSQNVPKFTDVAKESPQLAETIAGIMAKKYNDQTTKLDEDRYSSSDSDDDRESVTTQTFGTTNSMLDRGGAQKMTIPTEILSTPAFPAMIERASGPILAPRPAMKPKQSTIKEIDTQSDAKKKLKPIPEESNKVLVLGQ